jgi:hypothetical protein
MTSCIGLPTAAFGLFSLYKAWADGSGPSADTIAAQICSRETKEATLKVLREVKKFCIEAENNPHISCLDRWIYWCQFSAEGDDRFLWTHPSINQKIAIIEAALDS